MHTTVPSVYSLSENNLTLFQQYKFIPIYYTVIRRSSKGWSAWYDWPMATAAEASPPFPEIEPRAVMNWWYSEWRLLRAPAAAIAANNKSTRLLLPHSPCRHQTSELWSRIFSTRMNSWHIAAECCMHVSGGPLKLSWIYGSHWHKYDCTINQKLADATAHARNELTAAILKLWHQIKNPTPSIDAYLLDEQLCQISSRCDLKRRSLRLFYKSDAALCYLLGPRPHIRAGM